VSPLTEEQRQQAAAHMPLAKSIARRWSQRTGLEQDELVGVAMLAMCEAASRYERERQVAFSTWVMRRIRGAVIDFCKQNYQRIDDRGGDIQRWNEPSYEQRESCDDLVDDLLRGVTKQERTAIRFRFVESMTQAEIGQRMGLCKARASQLITRGVQYLSECVRVGGDDGRDSGRTAAGESDSRRAWRGGARCAEVSGPVGLGTDSGGDAHPQ
jgi:RNA polymerase sigma factor (sigma-70 family)